MKKKEKTTYHINEVALRMIGSKMRELRNGKEISIERLDNSSGMDYSQLARMEGGTVNFSISYLFRVTEALGVTLKDLLP